MKKFAAVILAAGAGTRMNSSSPKVLHKLSGKSLIDWVIDSVESLKPEKVVVILGHKAELVEKALEGRKVKVVYQKEQLGSAHALMQAGKVLKSYNGDILVISGDVPLVKPATLASLLKRSKENKSSATILTAFTENPHGYGRIIRNGGRLEKIIEEKDATPAEKSVKEINSGIYCFDKNIWKALSKVKPDNAKKEYYLTDTIEILKKEGRKASFSVAKSSFEVKGINSRTELEQAERALLDEKISSLLADGVTVIERSGVYVSFDAKIGKDTVIYPGAFIGRGVKTGRNCVIKGSSFIENSEIGDNCRIIYSYISGAKIGNNVKIGPFSHIRKGSILKENAKVGNFSETKKSVIGKNSKVNHLSYIGDAEIGENVNIGAGTITCNYDGEKKHKTVVGAGSFVGSNVNFVAPVKIGKSVLVAAGSTITRDIPSGKLAIARARQEEKERHVKSNK